MNTFCSVSKSFFSSKTPAQKEFKPSENLLTQETVPYSQEQYLSIILDITARWLLRLFQVTSQSLGSVITSKGNSERVLNFRTILMYMTPIPCTRTCL